jgi:preprotein translocase subunit YajC
VAIRPLTARKSSTGGRQPVGVEPATGRLIARRSIMDQLQAMAPMLLFLVVAYGAMYLLMIRPQQQQQRKRLAMLRELNKGDRVVTTGGLFGWVTMIKDDTVKLRLAEKVEVELEKDAITRLAKEE